MHKMAICFLYQHLKVLKTVLGIRGQLNTRNVVSQLLFRYGQLKTVYSATNVLMFVLQVVPTYLLRVRTRPEAYPLCYFR